MLKLKQGLPGHQELLDTLTSNNGRYIIPGWHPVQGLVLSDVSSIMLAYQLAVNKTYTVTTNKHIKAILEAISLKDGNQCYGRSDVVMGRWTNMVGNLFTYERILNLSDKIELYNKMSKVTDIDYNLDPFMDLD
jgi:hypothetical protein